MTDYPNPISLRWADRDKPAFAIIELDRHTAQWLADLLPADNEVTRQLRGILIASDPAQLQKLDSIAKSHASPGIDSAAT